MGTWEAVVTGTRAAAEGCVSQDPRTHCASHVLGMGMWEGVFLPEGPGDSELPSEL